MASGAEGPAYRSLSNIGPLEDLRARRLLGQPAERLVDLLPLGHEAVDLALEPLLLVLQLAHLLVRDGGEEAGVRELLVDVVDARLALLERLLDLVLAPQQVAALVDRLA